jgi:polyhydroxybutyrate depolymerase
VLQPGDTTQTLQVGSLSRTYILHVPSAYAGKTAVPLVVDFHPIGGSDTGEEGASPFKAVTDPEGVVTAYPQGEPAPNFSAAWDVGPCCASPINGTAVNDVAFARALVAQVETKACIDTTRVYAVGFSMGGGMSHYLACQAADLFAAVSPASFDLLKGNTTTSPPGNADDCTPSRPIPELSFRGSNDNVALYNGGLSQVVTNMPITFLGAQACWQKWASIDGCTDSPAYPATPTSATWECAYYKQCQANVQVGVCINNGGHEYGDGTIGWNFLKQFTLP